ncbi:MAG: hypothetical protein ACRDRL_09630 [Sciscionella sp.]
MSALLLCAPPSMFSAKPGSRIRQKRPKRGRNATGPFDFDPAVESLGMTVDSIRGPVDLVAVERALAGIPVALTSADLGYLYTHLVQARAPLDAVAAALGIRFDSLKRHREHRRTAALAPAAGGAR